MRLDEQAQHCDVQAWLKPKNNRNSRCSRN